MENKFLLMKTIMPLSAVLEHLCAVICHFVPRVLY